MLPLYILQINPLGHIDCVPIKPLKTLPEAIYSSISISSSNTCPENEDSSAARARATARALARRLARALAWRMKNLSLSLIENWKRPTAGTMAILGGLAGFLHCYTQTSFKLMGIKPGGGWF